MFGVAVVVELLLVVRDTSFPNILNPRFADVEEAALSGAAVSLGMVDADWEEVGVVEVVEDEFADVFVDDFVDNFACFLALRATICFFAFLVKKTMSYC